MKSCWNKYFTMKNKNLKLKSFIDILLSYFGFLKPISRFSRFFRLFSSLQVFIALKYLPTNGNASDILFLKLLFHFFIKIKFHSVNLLFLAFIIFKFRPFLRLWLVPNQFYITLDKISFVRLSTVSFFSTNFKFFVIPVHFSRSRFPYKTITYCMVPS